MIKRASKLPSCRGLPPTSQPSENPRRDENLKKLIADAVKRVEKSGWANSDGFRVGQGYEYYGRYLRLAGAFAWLGIDYRSPETECRANRCG